MNQAVTHSNAPARGGSGAVPRILVVDDEQHMCDVCSRTLQRGSYEVIATSDSQTAVQLLRGDQRFDLLLTDIKMPDISGLELAKIARERDPAIAIIIMTGYTSMENLHQSVRRGVADFLSKPFELEQLRLAVDQALHKRSILQDNLRLHALEQLFESSRAMSSTLELTELTRIFLRVTLQRSGCPAGFLLLAEEPDTLTMIVPAARTARLLGAGRALAQRAFEERQSIISSDTPVCQFQDRQLSQALAVPLSAQGNVNGVLLLCDEQPGAFQPGIQEEIALLANFASAALRNAYLYSQLGEAYQRLQEMDRLKSEFIAIASHELRTPLSIVLGYTMMVRDQTEGTQREYLQRVMESSQRIKEIVDDMISLRHVDTGESQMASDLVVLQELIPQVVERQRPTITARRQQIDIVLPEAPLAFLCDREKILLIIGHLLSNAVKFTPEGGQVRIRAAIQPAGALNSGGSRVIAAWRTPPTAFPWVVIEVQDTGIGIPEREQTRIFDRFYQVADSLTRDRGGTGLGLALVRELVGALGGAVWVTSREGQGSTFSFALPYRHD